MRMPSKRALAPLTAGVLAVGGLAYAMFPGAQGAKGDSASPSRTAQAVGPARGYAHVSFTGTLTAQSKGVVGVRRAVDTNSKRLIIFGAYCFDLTFSPVVLIGSPVATGDDLGSKALSVSVAGPNVRGVLTLDGGRPIECPVGFRDAAVVLRSPTHKLSMSAGGVFVLFY